jgi:hypothetical protein
VERNWNIKEYYLLGQTPCSLAEVKNYNMPKKCVTKHSIQKFVHNLRYSVCLRIFKYYIYFRLQKLTESKLHFSLHAVGRLS